MRVLILVKASATTDEGYFPQPWTSEMMEAMGRFNDELQQAGILLMAEGLTSSALGKRIAFDGSGRTVIDGPFARTSDLVAGFWLWEVKNMDEAVTWLKRCPSPMPGPSLVEIRPLLDLADFQSSSSASSSRQGD